MRKTLALLALLASATCFSAEGNLPRPKVTELMKHDFTKDIGTEGRMLTVDFEPGAGSPPHQHPGALFIYVLEGAVLSGANDEPAKVFKAGEFWYEHPGCIHRVAENASKTEKAKLLVFFVTKPGNPVSEPLKK